MCAVTLREVKRHVNRRPKCQVHFLTVSTVWHWHDNGIRGSITIKGYVMKIKRRCMHISTYVSKSTYVCRIYDMHSELTRSLTD